MLHAIKEYWFAADHLALPMRDSKPFWKKVMEQNEQTGWQVRHKGRNRWTSKSHRQCGRKKIRVFRHFVRPAGWQSQQKAGDRKTSELFWLEAESAMAFFSEAICQIPGEASPHVDGVSAYRAVLRLDGEALGLVVTEPKPPMRNLLILKTATSHAVQVWNFLNPRRRIEVGHAIMAVNGKTDPYQMQAELANAQTLNLFIKDKLTRVQQLHFDESLSERKLQSPALMSQAGYDCLPTVLTSLRGLVWFRWCRSDSFPKKIGLLYIAFSRRPAFLGTQMFIALPQEMHDQYTIPAYPSFSALNCSPRLHKTKMGARASIRAAACIQGPFGFVQGQYLDVYIMMYLSK